jgi:quinol monooxygenase YgiN
MVTAIIRHRVRNMNQWQKVFEENLDALWKSNCISAKVLRAADDPLDITVVCEWPKMEQLQAFVTSQMDSKNAERGGVIGLPEGRILKNYKTYEART